MIYKLRLTTNALEDIERHKRSGDIKVLQKIEKLLNELRVHPATGTGKPEKLKHDFKGLYSRRINRNHRLIYDIKENIVSVVVVSAYSHYGDK